MEAMGSAAAFLGTLCLAVYVLDWLNRHTPCRHLGSALLAIIGGAILANLGLVPGPDAVPALYRGVLAWVAPLAIFYLLLQVNLRDLRLAGPAMLVAFALAVPGVLLGAILGYGVLEAASGEPSVAAVVAGMLVAGHVGGSMNFNAVAIEYGLLEQADVYVTVLAVDHIMIAAWMAVTAIVPRLAARAPVPGGRPLAPAPGSTAQAGHAKQRPGPDAAGIALLAAAGFFALWASLAAAALGSAHGVPVPAILVITALALVAGHLPRIASLPGHREAGEVLVYLFLLIVGAHTDFAVLADHGTLGLAVLAVLAGMLGLHALSIFAIGRLLGIDWYVLAIGSQACIGGPVSAAALAEVLRRTDLVLPAVLVGALGSALGTFLGFGVVLLLD